MRKAFYLILLMAIFTLSSCSLQQVPSSAIPAVPEEDLVSRSMFNSPERTISEDDIQRLLNGKIKFGDSLRIAIFNYQAEGERLSHGRPYYYYRTDEEYLKTQQGYIETLKQKLTTSEKTAKVILMPSIMADRQSSITNLRETAIRLQADLLLVYSISSDIYYKYRSFSADEVKAFASVEAFLMDTRTGVIPFTTITTRESYGKKTSGDYTMEELRNNTEKEAVLKALRVLGTEIYTYLKETE
ncbi:hypothetical protein ACE01N_02925 [Saccharicrinis sp. FJH2]|uniref:hypothetical protein n=1 Tax=Saccharicrinis sp. FJH65 TaxID=3344659 RepID=UPI0035F3916C